MFWLLIIIQFMQDGSKKPLVMVEPTELACNQDFTTLAVDFHAHPPPGILGLGGKCDGPLDDPTVPKTGA